MASSAPIGGSLLFFLQLATRTSKLYCACPLRPSGFLAAKCWRHVTLSLRADALPCHHPRRATEVFLGVNQTIYPFQELSSTKTSVLGVRAPLPRGMFSYLVNEALESGIAPFRGKVDVYHPTYFRCMPMVRSRRIVATHHDCTHEQFPHLFPDVGKVLRAKKSLYAKADIIVCVSEASRRCLLEFYAVDPAKTRVVHHGLTSAPAFPGGREGFGYAVAPRVLAVCGRSSLPQELRWPAQGISRDPPA